MRIDNFFAWLLFYSILVNADSNDCNCTPFTTPLHKFHDHVLKRRIRSIVFPSKAQLLLTPAFTKAVLDGRPRGLSYSVEFDMYSPLPDTIEGWKPRILLNTLKEQVSSSQPSNTADTQIKNISQNYNESFHDHPVESQAYIENYDYYNFPFPEAEDINGPDFEWTHEPEFITDSYKKSNNLQGFASYFHKQPYSGKKHKRSRDFSANLNQKFNNQNKERTEKNELHNQSNLERKQIFKQLEIVGKIFKFNMKNCIQRAMCELTPHFRPYGESVMEDIVRLILVPSYSPHSSGHARYHVNNSSAKYVKVNCKQHYAVSCPYSILDLLIKNINIDYSNREHH